MPQRQEIENSFLKGINRAVSRDGFSDPQQLFTCQNARILQTGKIGEAVRIGGLSELSTDLSDLDTLYDIILFGNNFVSFYKDTGGDYNVKLIDSSGTLVQALSYSSSINPTRGGLKLYDDTIFIAPHNKIVYEKEGTYYLKDFISELPKIDTIELDDTSARKAKRTITVNTTLDAYGGQKGKGLISFAGSLIPQNTGEQTFNIKIGNDVSDPITITSSDTPTAQGQAIVDAINTSTDLGNWTATLGRNGLVFTSITRINIEATTVGDSVNGTEISIINNSLIQTNNQSNQSSFVGQSFDLTGRANIYNISGGISPDTNAGSIRIGLKDGIVTRPILVKNTDSKADIATNIESAMSSYEVITDQYNISRSSNVVTLEAKSVGKAFNTNVTVSINVDGSRNLDLPDNFIIISESGDAGYREGTDEDTNGTLKPFTNYWYKARLKYVDGHVTSTCSPSFIESGANGIVSVTFNIPTTDLDGNYPNIQVFRKEESEGFFLIEDLDLDLEFISGGQFIFVDDGSPNIEPLVEIESTWTKEHQTMEVMDNRLLKGNLEFFDESIGTLDFDLSTTTVSDTKDIAPYKSKAKVYVRPQYTDGTKGFFKEINEVDITSKNQEITVRQNAIVTSTEKTISELNFYARYSPFGEEQSLSFNTPEIQTPALSGIEDPEFFPAQTTVMFGYRYLLYVDTGDGPTVYTSVKGWDQNESEVPFRFIGNVNSNPNINEDGRNLIVNVHGEYFTYVPVAQGTAEVSGGSTGTSRIYQLEAFEALEEAVSTGELYVTIPRSNTRSLSSIVSDDDILDSRVKVTGLDDKSIQTKRFRYKEIVLFEESGLQATIKTLLPPDDCRLYLILEDSLLDEIDNTQINRYEYRVDREGDLFSSLKLDQTGSVPFKLINFEKDSPATYNYSNQATQYSDEGTYNLIEDLLNPSNHAKYFLLNRELNEEEQVIYLGSKNNTVDGSYQRLDTTGFRFKLRTNLFYSRLAPYNIYDNIIKESDFNFERTVFTNQIIWSNPLVENNYFSGGRNFETTNFYNIPTENGDIIDIVSLEGSLYAFCERGVARLLVGEVLTQQKSGQVFIDSSGFITDHVWILENIPPIKEDSIVKKDNQIYFTDGNDVYRLGQQIENISQGILNLDSTINYVGTVVNEYDEYRLSDTQNSEMFVYNTKYGVWYGPHTYTPLKTVEIGDVIISYTDTIIQEDVGNTFNGVTYNTIIESVGNDTEIGSFDKTYRKFYLDTDNGSSSTFSYGKDFNSMVDVDLSTSKVKNGRYHLGIKGTEGNTKKIYWKVTSDTDGFSLKGLRTAYVVKRRR